MIDLLLICTAIFMLAAAVTLLALAYTVVVAAKAEANEKAFNRLRSLKPTTEPQQNSGPGVVKATQPPAYTPHPSGGVITKEPSIMAEARRNGKL